MKVQGIPLELYHDRHSIFENHDKKRWPLQEELQGRSEQTQFARALSELGIGSIPDTHPRPKTRLHTPGGAGIPPISPATGKQNP